MAHAILTTAIGALLAGSPAAGARELLPYLHQLTFPVGHSQAVSDHGEGRNAGVFLKAVGLLQG